VPGEKELLGKGVIYCATCDAPLFKNKVVAVIGGGNSALDAVMQLDKLASKVYLVNLMDTFAPTADAVLISRLSQSDKIEVIMSSQTKEIRGSSVVETLVIENTQTKAVREIPVQGVFIEIGSEPSVGYLPPEMKLNQWKEIIVDDHNMTSIEGIFAGGDVTNVTEKQVIIAAGEGAKAALGASRFLETRHYAEGTKQQY
jgi:alkyl hydroperoxide reductase subunit F